MMLILEPSLLSFDSFQCIKKYEDEDSELLDFKEFISNLDNTLADLSRRGYKLPVSKEYWKSILQFVPVSTYSDPRYKIAKELYTIKLPRFIKVVHRYGDHNLEGQFQAENTQNRNLLGLDIYFAWIDLLLCNVNRVFPEVIVKSPLISIFNEDQVLLTYGAGSLVYRVSNSLDEACTCSEFFISELRISIKQLSTIINIQCSGTGTHDSMWGKVIRNVNDIPGFERQLVLKFFETNLVKGMTFLSFEKQCDVAGEPFIKIGSIEEGVNADKLMCEIHGRGEKQNCQLMSIEVVKGFGKKIAIASKSKIDEIFLSQIISS